LRRKRRARQTLCWAVGTFVLVQLGVGLALDCWGAHIRFPYAARTIAQVKRLPQSPLVISLGSSRMGLCFRATEVAQCLRQQIGDAELQVYNAAIPRGDLLTAEFVLDGLLRQGAPRRGGVLIVEVSPETLARRNDWLDTDIKNQFTWADLPRLAREIRYAGAMQLRSLLSSRTIPIYLYRQQLRRELALGGIDEVASDNSGLCQGATGDNWTEVYERLANSADFQQRTAMMLPGLRKWLRDYEIGGLSESALKRLLQHCGREQIQVVLVGMPVTSAYRQCYSPEVQRQYHAYLQEVTEKFGCRFVDYQDQVPDPCFWDGYHVLAEGGKLFSARLVKDALIPTLIAHGRINVSDVAPTSAGPPH
jgi:hypothetical protein